VALGPGSFTGLRIGLAFAKGLALSHRLPIIGIPTLDISAHAVPISTNNELTAVLEIGRHRLAIQHYLEKDGKWQPVGDLRNQDMEEFKKSISKPVLICGEINRKMRQYLKNTQAILATPVQCVRRPAVLAELAWTAWKKNNLDDPSTLKPIYLHQGEPIPG
jgi:tRNA threonylcarbamoyladenosine biosynthesis protein TsaB